MIELCDEDFIAEFERAAFPRDGFPHRAHLRMAWIYVTHLGPEVAVERAARGIRRLAAAHGHETLYHDTMTRAWVYTVAAAVRHHPGADFEEFLAANPDLLDRQRLLRHYSPDLLASARARAAWLAPNLEPIPGAPPTADAGSGSAASLLRDTPEAAW